MDGSLINMPERLRVWRTAGIRHFLRSSAHVAENPTDASAVDAPDDADLRDPETWPAPWSQFFARTAKSPRFVFTYWELGQDLSGKGNPARSQLWRELLSSLSWPAGTVSFWPLSVFSQNSLLPEPKMFHKGLKILCPERLICFGGDAFQILFPQSTFAVGEMRYDAFPTLVLPAPHELIADANEEKSHARQILSRWYSSLV